MQFWGVQRRPRLEVERYKYVEPGRGTDCAPNGSAGAAEGSEEGGRVVVERASCVFVVERERDLKEVVDDLKVDVLVFGNAQFFPSPDIDTYPARQEHFPPVHAVKFPHAASEQRSGFAHAFPSPLAETNPGSHAHLPLAHFELAPHVIPAQGSGFTQFFPSRLVETNPLSHEHFPLAQLDEVPQSRLSQDFMETQAPFRHSVIARHMFPHRPQFEFWNPPMGSERASAQSERTME